VVTDLVDGHVLLKSPEGEADYGALGDIESWPTDEAGDAGFFEEFEEVAVEVQGGGFRAASSPTALTIAGLGVVAERACFSVFVVLVVAVIAAASC